MALVPYNKLLTNLASWSRTEEYWTSVVFVRTLLRSVRTATTSGIYKGAYESTPFRRTAPLGHLIVLRRRPVEI